MEDNHSSQKTDERRMMEPAVLSFVGTTIFSMVIKETVRVMVGFFAVKWMEQIWRKIQNARGKGVSEKKPSE
ncbi:MAG: hypothetical protein AB7O73_15045 [Bacteroidia bacterium]